MVSHFHQKTQNANTMILLVSRLLILLFVAIISSQTAVILLMIAPYYVIIIYSVGCCVNIYCLWLNFHFSTPYYRKYFCGEQCIKCCFPMVKTLALTCSDCSDGEKNGGQQCAICCCYCCKHCCNENERMKQKKLYLMSKTETELVTL